MYKKDFSVVSNVDSFVYDFGIAKDRPSSSVFVPTSSSSASTIPTPTIAAPVAQIPVITVPEPTPTPEPKVHNAAPVVSLDVTPIVIKPIVPTKIRKTFKLPKKLLDTGTPVDELAAL